MNRNIWTWLQLVASLCNATFLVLGHLATSAAAPGVQCSGVTELSQLRDSIVVRISACRFAAPVRTVDSHELPVRNVITPKYPSFVG
jgi:hypothetical protein